RRRLDRQGRRLRDPGPGRGPGRADRGLLHLGRRAPARAGARAARSLCTGAPRVSELDPLTAEIAEIAERLAAIEARIDAAFQRRATGHEHDPKPRLIGVSKRQPLIKLAAAHAAGLRDFGENYAQELRDKQRDWPR